MNWKTWMPLVLAIVLGGVAAKVARDVILKNQASGIPSGKFTKVVVTKADVHPGKELKADDLKMAQVDSENAPAGAFKTVEEVVGRVSDTLMVKGQPVVEAMLAATGSGSGLQALVPPGMRAITMEVNEFSGVAGLLTPGCRVDILATINDGGNGQQIARTIVQNVKVSAVGQRTMAASNEPPPPNDLFKSVTVLASLAEAEAIELACSTGRPRLVLRGGRDNQVVATAGISLGELKGGSGRSADPYIEPVAEAVPTASPAATTQPTDAVARREPAQRVVKLIKAGVETSVTFNALSRVPENSVSNTNDPFTGN